MGTTVVLFSLSYIMSIVDMYIERMLKLFLLYVAMATYTVCNIVSLFQLFCKIAACCEKNMSEFHNIIQFIY